VKYVWCEFFHCLPSELDKEDCRTIEMFIAIRNELDFRKMLKEKEMEAESKVRG
jgi:hypothetical protein